MFWPNFWPNHSGDACYSAFGSQSQCFASVNQRAGARIWPRRRQRWPAAQSCRLPGPQKGALRRWQGNRHHCLSVFDGLCDQSVGKAAYRHAKALGFSSLAHRAGIAVASSVTMRPFLSRAFVKKSHIVTCRQFDGSLSQSVAKAEYRHCQDARKSSPVASQGWQHERCGAGCVPRLAGASWLAPQFDRRWCATATANLHNAPFCKVSASQSLKLL